MLPYTCGGQRWRHHSSTFNNYTQPLLIILILLLKAIFTPYIRWYTVEFDYSTIYIIYIMYIVLQSTLYICTTIYIIYVLQPTLCIYVVYTLYMYYNLHYICTIIYIIYMYYRLCRTFRRGIYHKEEVVIRVKPADNYQIIQVRHFIPTS